MQNGDETQTQDTHDQANKQGCGAGRAHPQKAIEAKFEGKNKEKPGKQTSHLS